MTLIKNILLIFIISIRVPQDALHIDPNRMVRFNLFSGSICRYSHGFDRINYTIYRLPKEVIMSCNFIQVNFQYVVAVH